MVSERMRHQIEILPDRAGAGVAAHEWDAVAQAARAVLAMP